MLPIADFDAILPMQYRESSSFWRGFRAVRRAESIN
jgi:hypothetical protein